MSALPDIDLSALPDDQRDIVAALLREHGDLKGENADLKGETTTLKEIIKRLEHLVAELNHVVHGKKSEKLSEDDRQLAFEDLEAAVAEVEEHHDSRTSSDAAPHRKTSRARRNRGNLPKDLPRIEQVVEPDSLGCPCGCGQMHKIGEGEPSRRHAFETDGEHRAARHRARAAARDRHRAPQIRLPRLHRWRHSGRAIVRHWFKNNGERTGDPDRGRPADRRRHRPCAGQQIRRPSSVIPPEPDPRPVGRRQWSLGPVAQPLATIHRSTLADWVGVAAFHLRPVVDRLAERLKASTKLFMDETRAPVLDPGRGRTKTGYLWALARDDRGWGGADPPGVVYFYAPDRGGQNAERFLSGFDGTLQLDGYQGYNRLTRLSRKGGDPIHVAHCWAHARRKLKEVFDRDGSEIAAEGLRRIAELYAVETDIRGIDPGQRLSARQARTAPLVAAFGDWLQEQRLRVSAKSRLGEKLAYIHRHWDGLQTFLQDGRVEIDSNSVENLIRPIALNRKNALFAGHDEGGKAWGRIASLIETAKINGVEPFAYLKATLEAIANGHPQNRIDDLLPWNLQPSS